MLSRCLRRLPRRFGTTDQYFDEHYQYRGNPELKEFEAFAAEKTIALPQHQVVFKPEGTIEFDRIGTKLIYTAEPFRHKAVYFPYPHSLPWLSSVWMLHLYFVNPLALPWQFNNALILLPVLSWLPQAEYLFNFRYYISKIQLMRGGEALRIEHQNILKLRWRTWIFIDEINLLTPNFLELEPNKGADVELVSEDGQLKYETHIEVDNFVDVGRNMENQVLMLIKEGTVHDPKILNAVLRGFKVDTSDFVINTLHTERWLEPNFNG
mmetsp:Transcript_9259/g.17687  ORF Transcript_9259/g.17687 Transcript_9259/m.17687 type:complete len:266 (-) Transcript_9259:42-839(-)